MGKPHLIKYPMELRTRCQQMRALGMTYAYIVQELGIRRALAVYWVRGDRRMGSATEERSRRSGSGVTAGKPYARGYRWWNTKWN